jgi:hypothetical protein
VDDVTTPLTPLPNFTAFTYTADPDSPPPAEVMQYDGKTFLFPPEYLQQLGTGAANPGVLDGVRGYVVTQPNGQHLWMMIGAVTKAIRDAFLTIPGPHSWTVPASLNTFRNVGTVLVRDYGVPGSTVVNALGNLYNAAVVNASTPPPGG